MNESIKPFFSFVDGDYILFSSPNEMMQQHKSHRIKRYYIVFQAELPLAV